MLVAETRFVPCCLPVFVDEPAESITSAGACASVRNISIVLAVKTASGTVVFADYRRS
ncbi:hypothetical protein [Candidatus Protofrankia californiensis]|uniref:hypothetical protein n=1 Tax=Candidatus Protofrankia californiensis TaxID=1839754 RepID=UPI0013EB8784|nr:hypothetical protein [Candidatus Protofrankia californiensis]